MILFFDLDLTLVYSSSYDSRDDRATFIDHGDGEGYYTFLKGGALDFLRRAREKYPVRMLTAAQWCYARNINDVFKLGFKPDEIFAQVSYSTYVPPEFPREKVVLLDDNDPKDEHAIGKMRWLHSFAGKVKYIQAPHFLGSGKFHDSWVSDFFFQVEKFDKEA